MNNNNTLHAGGLQNTHSQPAEEPLKGPKDRVAGGVQRQAGVDAYRGIGMFLMMAEVLRLSRMAEAFPDSGFWQFLARHQSHVAWEGCSLHDLIQPSFSFLVGVALPFSLANRIGRGQSNAAMWGHAIWRALVLIALGIFLRSLHRPQTYFTFEDTLSQIGLGYLPLFLLGFVGMRTRWAAFTFVVIGYWVAFLLYPLPGEEFAYAAVGVPDDWPHHATGLAAHFNKNSNLAWASDTWFLNLFPRETPFLFNGGGYATLSFIPTLGTMILGLIAGSWLKADMRPAKKLLLLVATGVLCIVLGSAAAYGGLCPIVKRIWTPAWVLFSGGWCLLILAGLSAICDLGRFRLWAYPFMVIGANSITAYCMAHLTEDFFEDAFRTHLGPDIFESWGTSYAPLLSGICVLLCFYAVLQWMYRQRIFVRI